MLSQGTIIRERYKVVRLIGKGGLSYVYEVEDLQLPKRWAMKEFHPRHLAEDEIMQARRQFQSEVKILSELAHPRLPAVSDSFHFEGKDYLVMELVEGKTLDELLRERTEPFLESAVREWALQVLEILDFLHGRTPPVIYRDIKPQNIIIDETFGVRFVDFGIARLFNPVKEQDTVFMGTPGFSPPEQFRQRQSDFRSDIYSLGATMHYLLTLRDPGNNPFDFEPASLTNPAVSKLMEAVVQRATEIKAENRFQCAADMRRALTGEVPLEELFRRSFLILEPRELEMLALDPRARHRRELAIRNTSGEAVKAVLTAEHPGIGIEPPAFDAPRQAVSVSLNNRAFPRGERVTTALVLTTEKAKITVPVTVEFRPTFFKGLSPALASLLLFLTPALLGLLWVHHLAAPPPLPPWADTAALALSVLLVALSLPLRAVGLASLFLFLGLAGLMLPICAWVRAAASAEVGLQQAIVTPALLFTAVDLLACTVLFRLACRLTARHRSEMKLVVPASFFVFPALLYLYPYMLVGQASTSFVLRHNSLFFCLGSLVALTYAFAWHLDATRDGAEVKAKKSDNLVSALWMALLSVSCGAVWYLQNLQAAADPLFLAARPALRLAAQYTALLPRTMEALFPSGALLSTAAAALAVFLFHLLARRVRIAALILMALLFGSSLLNLAFCLDETHRESRSMLMRVLRDSPEKILTELSSIPGGPFDAGIRVYYNALTIGTKKILVKRYQQALQKLEPAAASMTAEERGSVDGKKLRFMVDQARVWNYLDNPDSVTFDYFDEELRALRGGEGRKFSSLALSWFQSCRPGDDAQVFRLLPGQYFFLINEKDGVRMACDRDVLYAVLFYRAFLDECRGKLDRALEGFAELDGLIAREGRRTAVMEALCREAEERRSLALHRKDIRRYYQRLAAFYRLSMKDSLAVPLLLSLAERFVCPVMEKGELVDTLYRLGEPERGDAVYGRLRASAASRSEAAYLDAVRLKAKGDVAGAHALLTRLAGAGWEPAGSPAFLRKWRDCAVALRRWDDASALSKRLEAADPRAFGADDWLKRGWSCDVRGRRAEALACYGRYDALMGKIDPASRRLATIRNRLAGGPLPFYIVMEEIAGDRFRTVICGEGIPQEGLPELIYYHAARETPPVKLSPNIRLRELRTFKNKNYRKTYSQVVFLDPGKERASKSWRFSVSLNFRHPSFYPSEFVRQDPDTFNALYLRCVSSRFPPDSRLEPLGITTVQGTRHRFVSVDRFAFDPPFKMLDHIDHLHNLPSRYEYFDDEVEPGELFELFGRP